MGYKVEGRILEVCDCKVLCPCWIGEDPDNGSCLSSLAYRFDKGAIDGCDAAGITFEVAAGKGTLKITGAVEAVMEPYRGPTREPTQLLERIFSTIPGSPAYVAKADSFAMTLPELGIDLHLEGHNAIQGTFLFEA